MVGGGGWGLRWGGDSFETTSRTSKLPAELFTSGIYLPPKTARVALPNESFTLAPAREGPDPCLRGLRLQAGSQPRVDPRVDDLSRMDVRPMGETTPQLGLTSLRGDL